LNDYIAWSKLARSKDGHYNNLILANHHIVPWLAHVPLEEFNAVHMQALAERVLTTPRKLGFTHDFKAVPFESLSTEDLRRRKRTYNSLITILRVAFNNAYDSGKIQSERPWRCLRRISVRHAPRLLFLDRDECTQLIEACLPALSKLVRAALYTGCRVGELGQMTVKDVGREGYGVRVAAFKANPARFVFLPDEGMSFFLRQCEGKTANEPLFLSPMNKPGEGSMLRFFGTRSQRRAFPENWCFTDCDTPMQAT
jgi:integrase